MHGTSLFLLVAREVAKWLLRKLAVLRARGDVLFCQLLGSGNRSAGSSTWHLSWRTFPCCVQAMPWLLQILQIDVSQKREKESLTNSIVLSILRYSFVKLCQRLLKRWLFFCCDRGTMIAYFYVPNWILFFLCVLENHCWSVQPFFRAHKSQLMERLLLISSDFESFS